MDILNKLTHRAGSLSRSQPTKYWIHDYIEAPEHNVAVAIAVVVLTLSAIVYIVFGKPTAALTRSKDFMRFKLVQKRRISPNTAQYRFALPRSTDFLGLPIGQHISVQAKINGKNVQRSYTPVSSDEDTGFFDLMIKSYPQGNISKHVGEMKIGDYLEVKGPKGQMKYTPDLSRNIGMIAGGTGITPMLQIIRAALKNPDDPTQLSLIYANVKPEDILLKEELDQLAGEHKDRFSVYYVLNEPPASWDGGKGFVTKDIIKDRFKGPEGGASESKVLLCGPPPMIKAMKGALEELGYEKANTVSKLPDQTFSF